MAYRWASCSNVKPMPPSTCTVAAVALGGLGGDDPGAEGVELGIRRFVRGERSEQRLGLRQLGLHRHVGAGVLDRLVHPDRPVELHPRLGVCGADVARGLGDAGEHRGGEHLAAAFDGVDIRDGRTSGRTRDAVARDSASSGRGIAGDTSRSPTATNDARRESPPARDRIHGIEQLDVTVDVPAGVEATAPAHRGRPAARGHVRGELGVTTERGDPRREQSRGTALASARPISRNSSTSSARPQPTPPVLGKAEREPAELRRRRPRLRVDVRRVVEQLRVRGSGRWRRGTAADEMISSCSGDGSRSISGAAPALVRR